MKNINFEVGDKLKCKNIFDSFICQFTKNSYYKIVNKVSTCFYDVDTELYEYYILDDLEIHVSFYFICEIEEVFDFNLFKRIKKLDRLQNII